MVPRLQLKSSHLSPETDHIYDESSFDSTDNDLLTTSGTSVDQLHKKIQSKTAKMAVIQSQLLQQQQLYYLKHHLLPDHENLESYDGIVRQISFRFPSVNLIDTHANGSMIVSKSLFGKSTNVKASDLLALQRNLTSANGNSVINFHQSDRQAGGHRQSSSSLNSSPSASSVNRNATLATPMVMDHESNGNSQGSYGSTAISVAIAIGCSLLILNILIFVGVYYQLERAKANGGAGISNGLSNSPIGSSANGSKSLPLDNKIDANSSSGPPSLGGTTGNSGVSYSTANGPSDSSSPRQHHQQQQHLQHQHQHQQHQHQQHSQANHQHQGPQHHSHHHNQQQQLTQTTQHQTNSTSHSHSHHHHHHHQLHQFTSNSGTLRRVSNSGTNGSNGNSPRSINPHQAIQTQFTTQFDEVTRVTFYFIPL